MARPPSNRVGEGRAKSLAATASGNLAYSCYCRWQLRPVGSNRGGPCVVFVHPDGRWCEHSCTYRDNVLARINAGVHKARLASQNSADHPPGSDPQSVVPPTGDRT